QIQNIIPAGFFHTTAWAAPRLGIAGAVFLLAGGVAYLDWRRRAALRRGEGYGAAHINEPEHPAEGHSVHPAVAVVPLAMVGVLNWCFTHWLAGRYAAPFDFAAAGLPGIPALDTSRLGAIWAVECALAIAILFVLGWSIRRAGRKIVVALNTAVGG